jgi:hypothetical protein
VSLFPEIQIDFSCKLSLQQPFQRLLLLLIHRKYFAIGVHMEAVFIAELING